MAEPESTNQASWFTRLHEGRLRMPYSSKFGDLFDLFNVPIADEIEEALARSSASTVHSEGTFDAVVVKDGFKWHRTCDDPSQRKSTKNATLSTRAVNALSIMYLRTSFHASVTVEGLTLGVGLADDFLSSRLYRPLSEVSNTVDAQRWLGLELNLCEHDVQLRGLPHAITLCGSVVDAPDLNALRMFGGIMPAVFPLRARDVQESLRLRPELVRDLTMALCADVFHPDLLKKDDHIAHVAYATLYMVNVRAPMAAKHLNRAPNVSCDDVVTTVHAFGINLRYLGWLLPWVNSAVGKIIKTEMLARACCHLLFYQRSKNTMVDAESLLNALDECDIIEEALSYFCPPSRHLAGVTSMPHLRCAIPLLEHAHAVYDVETSLLDLQVIEPHMQKSIESCLASTSFSTSFYQKMSQQEPSLIPSQAHAEYDPESLASLSFKEVDMTIFRDRVHAKAGMHGYPPHIKTSHTRLVEVSRWFRGDLSKQTAMEYMSELKHLLSMSVATTQHVSLLKTLIAMASQLEPYDHNGAVVSYYRQLLSAHCPTRISTSFYREMHTDLFGELATFMMHPNRGEKYDLAVQAISSGMEISRDPIRRVALDRLRIVMDVELANLPQNVLKESYVRVVVALEHALGVENNKASSSGGTEAHHHTNNNNDHEFDRRNSVASSPPLSPIVGPASSVMSGINHRKASSKPAASLPPILQWVAEECEHLFPSEDKELVLVDDDDDGVPDNFLSTGLPIGVLRKLKAQHRELLPPDIDLYVSPPSKNFSLSVLDTALFPCTCQTVMDSIEDFLVSDRKLCVVVTEYGKSHTLLRVLEKMWTLEHRILTQVPVFISVKLTANTSGTLDNLIHDNLVTKFGLHSSEVAMLASNPSVVVLVDALGDLFGEDNSSLLGSSGLLQWEGKIIATMRKRRAKQIPPKDLLHFLVPDEVRMTWRGQLQIIQALKFNESCLHDYVAKYVRKPSHLGLFGVDSLWSTSRPFLHMIWNSVPGLRRVASKPVLTGLILKALPEVPRRGSVAATLVDVYDVLWTGWMTMCAVDSTELHFYCTSLATVMYMDRIRDVHVKPSVSGAQALYRIPPWVDSFFGEEQRSLMLSAPLDFNVGSWSYSFLHGSILSYFLALRVYLEVTDVSSPVGASNECGVLETIRMHFEVWSKRHKESSWRHDAAYMASNVIGKMGWGTTFKAGARQGVTATTLHAVQKLKQLRRNKFSFSKGELIFKLLIADNEALDFLADRVRTDQYFSDALVHIVKGRYTDFPHAATNALVILARSGYSFAGWDLRFVNASGVNFNSACMVAAKLSCTSLRRANFIGCVLDRVDTSDADLGQAEFGVASSSAVESSHAYLCVDTSKDGVERIVVGDERGLATLWTTGMESIERTYQHSSAVIACQFTPDMKAIATATGASDCIAYLWATDAGTLLATFSGHCARLSSIVTCSRSLFVTSGHDSAVYVWAIPKHETATTRTKPLPGVTKTALSLGGRSSPAPKAEVSATSSKRSLVTSLRADTTLATSGLVRMPKALSTAKKINQLRGTTNIVVCTRYNPVRDIVAAGSVDGKVTIWSMRTYTEVCTITLERQSIECLAFSPDGGLIAVPQVACCGVWDTTTGKRERLFAPNTYTVDHVVAMTFSVDAQFFAAAFESTLYLFDVFTTRLLRTFTGHTRRISAIDFTASADRIYTTSWDGTIRSWPTKQQRTLGSHLHDENAAAEPIATAKMVGTDAFLALASVRGSVELWHADTGELCDRFLTHAKGDVTAMAVHKDLQRLAIARDASISVHDLLSQSAPISLIAHSRTVHSLKFVFVNNTESLVSSSIDKSVRLWNLELRVCIHLVVCDGPVWSMCASLHNIACVYATNRTSGVQLYTLSDMRTSMRASVTCALPPSCIRTFVFAFTQKSVMSPSMILSCIIPYWTRAQQLNVSSMFTLPTVCSSYHSAMGPGGGLIVSMDKTAYFWPNSSDPRNRHAMEGHTANITAVGFVSGLVQQTQVTSSTDGTIRLWRCGTVVLQISCEGFPGIIAMSIVGGSTITAAYTDKCVRQWAVPGTDCFIGSKNKFSSASRAELKEWLSGFDGGSNFTSLLETKSPQAILSMTRKELQSITSDEAAIDRYLFETTKIIESVYEQRQLQPFDDGTLTMQNFAAYEREHIIPWLPNLHADATVNPVAYALQSEKVQGVQLLAMDLPALIEHFPLKYTDIVAALHQELNFVRQKFKEGFAQKTVAEVLMWVRTKSSEVTLAINLLRMSGAQLLDITDFPMVYSEICSDCMQPLGTTNMCAVTGRAHPLVSDTFTGDTTERIKSISALLRASFEQSLKHVYRHLREVPHAVFRHGVYWCKIRGQPGYMACLKFLLGGVRTKRTLVIPKARITLHRGCVTKHRILVAPDSSTFHFGVFTGCRVLTEMGTRRYATEETTLPEGWSKSFAKTSTATMEVTYHTPDGVTQPNHPTLPVSHGVEGDKQHRIMRVFTVVDDFGVCHTPEQLVATSPPMPEHFFKPTSANSGNMAVEADVTVQVAKQVKELAPDSEIELTLLLVAEDLDDVEDVATERPRLNVTYYNQDLLCRCQSAYKESELCDRLCNVDSTCTGHVCNQQGIMCKSAPHLKWVRSTKQ
eukprot:PhM_4_TR1318/c0_g1_i1/m.52934